MGTDISNEGLSIGIGEKLWTLTTNAKKQWSVSVKSE